MSIEDHMDKFLDLFGKFEECIEKRQIPEQITDRRNRIALFGIYLVTRGVASESCGIDPYNTTPGLNCKFEEIIE